MSNQTKQLFHEQCAPFIFAAEEPTVVNDANIRKLMDFICHYLLLDKNPRSKIAALCFASGMDVGSVFDCNNSIRQISIKLGLKHQHFSILLKQIQKEFGLININTDKPANAASIYHDSNVTKI